MCGIAGIHRRGSKPVPRLNELANNLLLAIEPRGKDASGMLAVLPDGKVQLDKRTIPARRFVKERGLIKRNARTVLLHTRYATVGKPDDVQNAHPVASGTMAAVHNGTIYNHRELFKEYGMTRLAEVDSEVVPALLMHHGWDNASKALGLLDGGAALGIVNTEQPDELILARCRSYPMVFMVTPQVVIFASTEHAIKQAWQRTYNESIPEDATMYTMPDYTMARVNGKVEIQKMEIVPRVRRAYMTRPITGAKKVGANKPVTKRAKKKARKAARGQQLSIKVKVETVKAPPLALDADDEWYVRQAVADFMRDGWSEDEAWELVDAPPAWSRSVERAELLGLYGLPDPQ